MKAVSLNKLIKFAIAATIVCTTAACGKKLSATPENPNGDGSNNSQTDGTTTTTTTLPGTSTTSTTTTVPGSPTTTSTTIPSSSTTTTTIAPSPTTTTTTIPSPTTTTTTTVVPPTTTTTTVPPVGGCTPQSGSVAAGTIKIDSGAMFTKQALVSLDLYRNEATMMKISDNDNCGCGTWVTYNPKSDWTLKNQNSINYVSVQYKDYEGNTSKCTSAYIVQDNLGPNISLTLDPANTYFINEFTGLAMEVFDSLSGVQATSCNLDNINVSCNLNNNSAQFVFANATVGLHKFTATALDKTGNSSTKEVTWTVKSKNTLVEDSHEIKAGNKVDILFVIDNSPSMDYEQKNMASRVSSFMNQIRDLDYKIAITTTDPKNKSYGDGRLVNIKGSTKYVIDNSQSLADGQKALGDTLQRSENGSSTERGIYVTYRMLERSLAGETPHNSFFRTDAAFATVLISDEDESDDQDKDKPENLLSLVNKTWPDKKFGFHSIITIPGDRDCRDTNGDTYGDTYAEMSKISKGIVGSVCSADYGSQLSGIGQSVLNLTKTLPLKCAPILSNGAKLEITLNDKVYSGTYTIQGLSLLFNSPLPAGSYNLKYECAP